MSVKFHTAETREKIAESMRGKTRPVAVREKIAATLKGKPFSAEHRANMSAAKTGVKRKPFSAEHRAKMRASQQARRDREEAAGLIQRKPA